MNGAVITWSGGREEKTDTAAECGTLACECARLPHVGQVKKLACLQLLCVTLDGLLAPWPGLCKTLGERLRQ